MVFKKNFNKVFMDISHRPSVFGVFFFFGHMLVIFWGGVIHLSVAHCISSHHGFPPHSHPLRKRSLDSLA